MSQYDDAFETQYPREVLTMILRITEDYYLHFGRFPNASELKALLMKPS